MSAGTDSLGRIPGRSAWLREFGRRRGWSGRSARGPKEWAKARVEKEIVREKVLALCDKRAAFVKAYAHSGCHRTSNLVDRLLRRLDYHLYCAQQSGGS